MMAWVRDRIVSVIRSQPARVLRGKIAIVTGASSGIGAATAKALAAHGATVVLAARRAAMLDEQARGITEAGGRALAVETDVSDPFRIANLAHHTLTLLGRIDVLVNCAGMGMPGPLARLSRRQINDHLATNLLGPILLTRAVLPAMVARRKGVIISVASLAGHVPVDPLYSATKFGLRGFSLALRRQLSGTGVSVSVISPGFIRTALTRDMRQELPGPEYVAEQIVRLVLSPRRELIIPRFYHLDVWMERILPSVMERLMRRRMSEKPGAAGSMTNVEDVRRMTSSGMLVDRPVPPSRPRGGVGLLGRILYPGPT